MKQLFILLSIVFPLVVAAQKDSLSSGVFKWKEPIKKSDHSSPVVLFDGSTHTMEWLQLSANTMSPANYNIKKYSRVPLNEERLIIVKSGATHIMFKDSAYLISTGSIVLLLPGQGYNFKDETETPCSYYLLRYRSKQPIDTTRGNASGGSVVKEWNAIEFKPNEKGGRRNFFERPTAMFKRIEAHVTTLKGSLQSHAPHTHVPAEFALVTEGKTEMEIGGKVYKGNHGDMYYVTSGILHGIKNAGTENCSYFAIQFE